MGWSEVLTEGCQKKKYNTSMFDAYLDIETTGLSARYAGITVIGIYLVKDTENRLVQLVGDDVTIENLLEALEGVGRMYTYNGSRFDLPFIRGSLGIDLKGILDHRDLMYDCWRCNLKGGLKAVERKLGITRRLKDVDGFVAVLLWQRYQNYGDQKALNKLLEYNKEDVVNLEVLRGRLNVDIC